MKQLFMLIAFTAMSSLCAGGSDPGDRDTASESCDCGADRDVASADSSTESDSDCTE